MFALATVSEFARSLLLWSSIVIATEYDDVDTDDDFGDPGFVVELEDVFGVLHFVAGAGVDVHYLVEV